MAGPRVTSTGCVFVDTGAWIALSTKRDINHTASATFYQNLSRSRARLVTTNYVLVETYTRLRYDDGLDKALRFHELIELAVASGRLQLVWVTPEHHRKAMAIFRRYSDHLFSFTDCTSFVVAHEARCSEVFGFDREFRTMGFLLRP